MNKKIIISLSIIICAIFSFSICLANNDGIGTAANNVRNFVGGVENTAENMAKDVSNSAKGATGSVENTMNHATNNNTFRTNDGNNGYTAVRTSTNNTFMGMNSTAWTWLIIGIAAIAIIAVVWYYSMQVSSNKNDRLD